MTLGTNLRGVSAVGERDLYARRSGSWRLVPPRVLEDLGAVFAIDAAQSIPGEQVVLNRGSGGQVLRAGYGSVRRAESRNGVGLGLPGANGNGGLAPDSAALDITGDIDLRVRVALDNWAPSALEVIVAKNNELTSQAGYALAVNTAGSPARLSLIT